MKCKLTLLFAFVCSTLFAKNIDFNKGWEFSTDSLIHHKIIDLPHDFSMEIVSATNDETHIGPFSTTSPNGRSLGYFMDGTGWYRKVFTVSREDRGKQFSLLFDGAYMETDVMVNGKTLIQHKNGYTPFYVDITSALKAEGQANEIIVKVRNFGKNSRWFSGSGIYRDVTLVGGCVHHDNGLLGAVAYKTAEYRRVRQLKENGYNAVRCAHNPPSKHFLEACDKLGLLVIDEFSDMWEQPKNIDDYAQFFKECWESDLESMLLRDRNHPSIIMWSIGNEIPNWSIADASRLGKQLSDKVRSMDATRLVTQGITGAYIHMEWDNSQYTFQHLDVAGYNYLRDKYDSDHEKFPERVIVCTESYPNQSYKYWKDAMEKPYVIGDFVWTALEHLGESGCGSSRYIDQNQAEQQGVAFQTSMGPKEGMNPAMMWMGGGGNATLTADNQKKTADKKEEKPAEIPFWMRPAKLPTTYINWCGDLDLIGDIKSQGRYRNVMWDISPIEILVHESIPEGKKETMNLWGWPNEQAIWHWPGHEGKTLQVKVVTKAAKVRLEVNSKIVATQDVGDELTALFEDVEYQPGNIVAIALDKNGKKLESKMLKTPGEPHAVRITREQNNIDNKIVYLHLEIVDKEGNTIPEKYPLSFQIKGAEFVSASNGAKDDMYSFRSETPSTYLGNAMLIVRPTSEKIEVTASSPNLVSGSVSFNLDGKYY